MAVLGRCMVAITILSRLMFSMVCMTSLASEVERPLMGSSSRKTSAMPARSSPRFRRVRSPSEMVRAFISPTRREAMCVSPRNFRMAFTRLTRSDRVRRGRRMMVAWAMCSETLMAASRMSSRGMKAM